MDSVRLVAQLVQCFRDVGLCGSQPQLCNLALLCHALAFGRDCHLANLALAMPLLECRLSREQRLQRLLQNEHVSVPLGFDLEASQIRDPGSLEHLLLGMALTTVWLIHIGEWLVRSGQRRTFARRAGDYGFAP
jgi:hypothetical protein